MFDWLTRRKEQAETHALARKEEIATVVESSPDSLYVIIKRTDGSFDVMDRDAFDYYYGDSTLPNPVQRDLDQLLPTITRVRVLSGGAFRGEVLESAVLLDTSKSEPLAALGACLQINADPVTFGHCMCLGGPTLELFAGPERAATISLHHGRTIRWSQWKHDSQLRDGGNLTAWLVKNGLDSELLEMLYKNACAFSEERLVDWGPAPLSFREQRLFLAEIFGKQRNLPAAFKECEAVLDGEPDLARAHALRGFLLTEKGEVEASVTAFSRAIDLGYDLAAVRYARALAHGQLGDNEAALVDCTSAITLNPNFCGAFNSRGIFRMKLGRLDEALQDLDAAIRLKPEWEVPYLNRAQVALLRRDWQVAISDYSVAIEKIQERKRDDDRAMLAKLYWNRSRAYRSVGDSTRAEADRREALDRDPKLAEV